MMRSPDQIMVAVRPMEQCKPGQRGSRKVKAARGVVRLPDCKLLFVILIRRPVEFVELQVHSAENDLHELERSGPDETSA